MCHSWGKGIVKVHLSIWRIHFTLLFSEVPNIAYLHISPRKQSEGRMGWLNKTDAVFLRAANGL